MLYEGKGFLEKGLTYLSPHMITALTNSPVQLVSELFTPPSAPEVAAGAAGAPGTAGSPTKGGSFGRTSHASFGAAAGSPMKGGARHSRVADSARQPTVGVRFAEQLGDLIGLVESTR